MALGRSSPRAVVLAGGGTGGHIFPALALAEAIRRLDPETQVSFMGTERGLETRLVPAAGVPLDLVPAAQIAGRSLGRKALGAGVLLRGVLRAHALLRARGAELVIGVGGYASVPAVAAAVLARIPVALLEPNARPGRANRALARFARAIFVQFEDARAALPADRVELLGYPVREIPKRAGPSSAGTMRLLVIGGSQGARSINAALCALLPRLELDGLRIAHQTGAADLEAVRAAYATAGVEAELAAFFDDVPERLARADLVIARAGAATVAELCAAGVGSILVPYPHAADDHQLANARELARAGACRLVEDRELTLRLEPELRALLADPAARARLAAAAAARGRPDAAAQIWARCRALARGAR
jgi:UDP-N-acetylglucosamine--N-acetylmuramyl-(pentapeptide) pyrophosphoryl-undecaprenol N-acetylglucosamine transferase